MAQRILDPEYLTAYRDELVARLNFVTELTGKLQPGNELGAEPGFGLLDSSQAARQQYAQAHRDTWDNLQKLRADLYGAIVTLNESMGLSTDAEELNIVELDATGSDL
ncbi:hypothetical protein K3N28_10930 [Glycomyces sp. TRM65418]|uniref:hypothetical protein n=1 Tax=Glycomyces sp. TRM65418 TaxID=2867006 RepID=UPI001CE5DD2F|nr:hypothetical protein [Glycomyces sp. TRM65418]MCC3763586.1 hypothetical protein [Glycomyces sp. TRM65418]QZD57569.1 hypothetical protein K3N28_10870 [Glycomyces sp. TRM65418]